MQGEHWIVDSETSLTAFIAHAKRLFTEHRYLTWGAPRIGPDRSIDQNSLFHVFLTEYAAHLLKKDKRLVTEGEREGMKRTVKREYWKLYHFPFMVHDVICPKTGATKKDFTSSKTWKRGEMFHVLNYMQDVAATDGLILESKGEHAKLKRQEVA